MAGLAGTRLWGLIKQAYVRGSPQAQPVGKYIPGVLNLQQKMELDRQTGVPQLGALRRNEGRGGTPFIRTDPFQRSSAMPPKPPAAPALLPAKPPMQSSMQAKPKPLTQSSMQAVPKPTTPTTTPNQPTSASLLPGGSLRELMQFRQRSMGMGGSSFN